MKCAHITCPEEGAAYQRWDYRENPPIQSVEYLCKEHAVQAGYCRHCGEFIGPDADRVCPYCGESDAEEIGELAPLFQEGV